MTKTLEEYIQHYQEKGYLLDGQYSNPDKKLNYGQLKHKYERYCSRSVRKEEKKGRSSDYMNAIYKVEEKCRNDDPAASIFYNRIAELDEQWGTDYEDYFGKKNKMLGSIYDPAHIFGRGSANHLSAEPLNIIMLPRFVHSMLDQYLEIFSIDVHKGITKERHEEIWRLIVGDERYNQLLELKRGK